MTNNQKDVIWLAGLLEGEGSFLARPGPSRSPGARHQARVQVAMCDEEIVQKAGQLMGCAVYARPKPQKAHWSPSWTAVAMSQKAEDVMRAVYPHMGSRRRAAIDKVLALDLSHHPRHA